MMVNLEVRKGAVERLITLCQQGFPIGTPAAAGVVAVVVRWH